MKAREVLNRYATGERNFRRANLRGQSFKGQDLSGADFTEADIRGANFTNATLQGVNFTSTKAGVQKRWLIGQLVTAFLLSAISQAIGGLLNALFIFLFFDTNRIKELGYGNTPGIVLVVLNIVLCCIIARQGFTTRAMGSIAITFAIAITGLFFISGVSSVAPVAVGVFFAAATAFAGAIAGAVAAIVTYAGVGIAVIAVVITIAVAITVAALSFYVAWQVHKCDERFALIRSISVVFAAISGTTFRGADLTGANFSKAILKSTNFTPTWKKNAQGKRQATETILDRVCWQDAENLDRARVGKSLLSNPAVRDLLVTRNGYKKSYVDANLRGADLNSVNLDSANLTWADLSGAMLHRANLKNANLLEALALQTDFTGATLTGACLEAWNIDSHTNLENVDCQYVYLLRDQQERRPSSGDFAPGEFTKLFQEALNTVDLIFRNGVDWKAFVAAFQTVQVQNEDTELTIR